MHRTRPWRKTAFILTLIIVIALLPVYWKDNYAYHLLTTVFINIIFAVSLRLSLMTGQFNVGHPAFIAIGGFGAVIMANSFGIPTGVSLLIGGLMAAIFSIPIGVTTLRLRGVYFALISIALLEVVRISLQYGGQLTGGLSGLHRQIPPLVIFGNTISGRDEFYWLAFVLMLLTIFILYRLEISRLGMTWKALSQSENLSASLGVNTMLYKTLAFSIGCFFAGLAGGFLTYFLHFIKPSSFNFLMAVRILIYCYVGGISSIAGPILGASFMTLISEPFRGLTYYETLFFALTLMLVIIFLPGGIITLPEKLRPRSKDGAGPKRRFALPSRN